MKTGHPVNSIILFDLTNIMDHLSPDSTWFPAGTS